MKMKEIKLLLADLSGARSTDLIADFSGEYAVGWKMAVHRAFRDALDIRLTERTELVNGVRTKAKIWTQGVSFSFKKGDSIYSAPAPGPWSEDLKKIDLGFEVVSASPAGMKSDQRAAYYDLGFVEFNELRVIDGRLRAVKRHAMSQIGFVKALRDGLRVA